MLVLINVLEFVTVIINYCATLRVFWTSPITDDPHPVILNVTNNCASNQKLGECLLVSLVHC